MKTKKIEIVKDRWSDGVVLEISHNGWQTTCINDLDLEDLKKLRFRGFKETSKSN